MTDTSETVARVVVERYREMTPAQRVRLTASMYDAAIVLARAGIREQFGDLPETEARAQLLWRLHGAELTETQINTICRVPLP